ncbi:MAG TPA: preprotein translocase subunit YajC [Flavobacteriaceae bacterium]|nr:preprotein translocase subunit YajC [Flavobacteriaceae bacterium]
MSLESILPFVLMFAVVYLFMIRPQLQKQKKEKKFITSLKKGDKVVTKSGLHGKVMDINEDQTLVIETGAGKLKFESSSISMEMSANLNK